jgi:hypothetical protein
MVNERNTKELMNILKKHNAVCAFEELDVLIMKIASDSADEAWDAGFDAGVEEVLNR